MDILSAILNAQNGAAVDRLGSQVGLGPDQTTTALTALVPALAAGFQRNIHSPGGLETLMAALSSGRHGQYVDNPATLADPAAVLDGNGILGHLLGRKEVSREVASRAAAQTGLSADVLQRLLPLAATLMMGAFAKQARQSPAVRAGAGPAGGGIVDMLTPLLDLRARKAVEEGPRNASPMLAARVEATVRQGLAPAAVVGVWRRDAP